MALPGSATTSRSCDTKPGAPKAQRLAPTPSVTRGPVVQTAPKSNEGSTSYPPESPEDDMDCMLSVSQSFVSSASTGAIGKIRDTL